MIGRSLPVQTIYAYNTPDAMASQKNEAPIAGQAIEASSYVPGEGILIYIVWLFILVRSSCSWLYTVGLFGIGEHHGVFIIVF